MNRTGLVIALAIAAATGVAFGIFPQLDLAITNLFYDPDLKLFRLNVEIWFGRYTWLVTARDVSTWIVAALAAPAVIALIAKLAMPRKPMLIPGRAAIYLLSTLALAPGLTANLILKDHWGRPRPIDVTPFNGSQHFVAWWDPRGDCPSNCSFVSGESSGAFWTLAPASLAPAQVRPLAYAAALAFGAAVGTLRMAFGGHFFSDVVFAGVFTFLICWLVYGVLYRGLWVRVSDEAIERAIERFALMLRGGRGASTR